MVPGKGLVSRCSKFQYWFQSARLRTRGVFSFLKGLAGHKMRSEHP